MQILHNCGKFSFLPPLQHLCCLSYSVWLWFGRKTLGSPRDLCMQNSQPHQQYRRGPTKCSHSETSTCNATSAYREGEISFPSVSLLFLEPRVFEVPAIRSSDLPSSLICTYFFLAAYFLQAFWMALAYPSYFLSLISSKRNSCTKRQWGRSNILHAKLKKICILLSTTLQCISF